MAEGWIGLTDAGTRFDYPVTSVAGWGTLHLRLHRRACPGGDRASDHSVAVIPDPRTGPAASVRLYADGKLVDSGTF